MKLELSAKYSPEIMKWVKHYEDWNVTPEEIFAINYWVKIGSGRYIKDIKTLARKISAKQKITLAYRGINVKDINLMKSILNGGRLRTKEIYVSYTVDSNAAYNFASGMIKTSTSSYNGIVFKRKLKPRQIILDLHYAGLYNKGEMFEEYDIEKEVIVNDRFKMYYTWNDIELITIDKRNIDDFKNILEQKIIKSKRVRIKSFSTDLFTTYKRQKDKLIRLTR